MHYFRTLDTLLSKQVELPLHREPGSGGKTNTKQVSSIQHLTVDAAEEREVDGSEGVGVESTGGRVQIGQKGRADRRPDCRSPAPMSCLENQGREVPGESGDPGKQAYGLSQGKCGARRLRHEEGRTGIQ